MGFWADYRVGAGHCREILLQPAARVLLVLSMAGAVPLSAEAELIYPGKHPGRMEVITGRGSLMISNQALAMDWRTGPAGLKVAFARAVQGGQVLEFKGELFEIQLADEPSYAASTFVLESGPRMVEQAPRPLAANLAARGSSRVVSLDLRSADGRLKLQWRANASDGANYIRQELEIEPSDKSRIVREVRWLNEAIPGARTQGQVDGSPVVTGAWFFACEDPHAANRADWTAPAPGAGSRVSCRLQPDLQVKADERFRLSFVLGVVPQGQERRGFLYYLERERAHPYRPFLHYNSWYDIAWEPFALNETNCLDAIGLFGERLIKPHGVVMDAMVFDDGWDDPRTLWQFHRGFPNGFIPLASLCAKYGTHLGVWLSPFGGYGESRNQRLRFGAAQGYETNQAGFSLSGRNYNAAFKRACLSMIRNYGVNHFKFDGIAAGTYAQGGAGYSRDTEAMERLMLELRDAEPNLYINLTTGSWPSPFWLRFADSIWRQGDDMGFSGEGGRQQQWLNYRDQEVYRNIVRHGPLFPLNALMTQGVAYSRKGTAGDPAFNSEGFKDDVRAFFGSGTGLQELYLQPGKLTPADWTVLAEAAKWSRANSDVLVDTHWLGGDPARGEVYGYASWNPRKGIVMLRNPTNRSQTFPLTLATAFELPPGAPENYHLRSPWAEDAGKPERATSAEIPVTVVLPAFGISINEAIPE